MYFPWIQFVPLYVNVGSTAYYARFAWKNEVVDACTEISTIDNNRSFIENLKKRDNRLELTNEKFISDN